MACCVARSQQTFAATLLSGCHIGLLLFIPRGGDAVAFFSVAWVGALIFSFLPDAFFVHQPLIILSNHFDATTLYLSSDREVKALSANAKIEVEQRLGDWLPPILRFADLGHKQQKFLIPGPSFRVGQPCA